MCLVSAGNIPKGLLPACWQLQATSGWRVQASVSCANSLACTPDKAKQEVTNNNTTSFVKGTCAGGFSHNLHKLMFDAMWANDREMALDALQQLEDRNSRQRVLANPSKIEPFGLMKYHCWIRFGCWDLILDHPIITDLPLMAATYANQRCVSLFQCFGVVSIQFSISAHLHRLVVSYLFVSASVCSLCFIQFSASSCLYLSPCVSALQAVLCVV